MPISREPHDEILRDPVCEVLLIGIAAEVVKGEHRDGRASLEAGDGKGIEVGERGIGCRRGIRAASGGLLRGSLSAPTQKKAKSGEEDDRDSEDGRDRTDRRLVITQPGDDAGEYVHAPGYSGSPALRRPSSQRSRRSGGQKR